MMGIEIAVTKAAILEKHAEQSPVKTDMSLLAGAVAHAGGALAAAVTSALDQSACGERHGEAARIGCSCGYSYGPPCAARAQHVARAWAARRYLRCALRLPTSGALAEVLNPARVA